MRALLPVALIGVLVAGDPVHAQAGPRLTVQSVVVSADTVGIGDRFDLTLTVDLAPRSVAFFPDSLYGRGFEPFEAVRWTTSGDPANGLQVEVIYTLMAFEVGPVTIPEFEVYAADARQSVSAGLTTEGVLVGHFEGFVESPESVPSARLRSVPEQIIYVASVLLLEDVSAGVQPRPPADVAGANRNWPASLIILASLGMLLSVLAVTIRDWMARAGATEPPLTPRAAALAALDDLLATGAHQDGRVRDFFEGSSEIVRRYVEAFDARWGPSWTSTELMGGLKRQSTGPVPTGLEAEMATAEEVKFGGSRPETENAEAHWQALHAWIEATPEPDSSTDGGAAAEATQSSK
jgi:hypothetical protein